VSSLALLSGCTSAPSASGPAAQAAVGAGDAPKVSAAKIDVTPASASVDVPVDQPVTVTAAGGKLTGGHADRPEGPHRDRRDVG
jgi:hypothetical protein